MREREREKERRENSSLSLSLFVFIFGYERRQLSSSSSTVHRLGLAAPSEEPERPSKVAQALESASTSTSSLCRHLGVSLSCSLTCRLMTFGQPFNWAALIAGFRGCEQGEQVELARV